jgi:hypothetical protein
MAGKPVASADEYRALAAENEALAKHLGGAKATKWQGWVVTTLFYAALHEVNAFLVDHEGSAPGDHCERNSRLAKYGDVSDPYMRLYGWSRDARYDDHVPDRRLNESVLLLVKVRAAIEAAG